MLKNSLRTSTSGSNFWESPFLLLARPGQIKFGDRKCPFYAPSLTNAVVRATPRDSVTIGASKSVFPKSEIKKRPSSSSSSPLFRIFPFQIASSIESEEEEEEADRCQKEAPIRLLPSSFSILTQISPTTPLPPFFPPIEREAAFFYTAAKD